MVAHFALPGNPMGNLLRALVLVVLAPLAAHAHGLDITGTWLGPGINFGYDFGAEGPQIGAEVSLVELGDAVTWSGLYADALYSFGGEAVRASLGLEGGIFLAGLDCGVAYDFGLDEAGARLRFITSLAMESAYVGTTWFPSTGSTWEVGILVKVPLPLDG